jgi:hypothetical protein
MRARVRRRAKGAPPFYPERVIDGPRRDSLRRGKRRRRRAKR